ncbi:MAG TPA: hypothetical protein VHR18_14555 [Solirubrobacterales bacterium]|nr:hypothetical protein [Solirubrobacterales bacterium]
MTGVRRSVDDFSVLTEPAAGSRISEHSWRVARRLSTVAGEEAPIIERYLAALAMAPAEHLELLLRRGTKIVFAPTVEHALLSAPATERRSAPLTAQERLRLRSEYSPESEVAAIFDPPLDLLIFPTHYCADDLERVVLHELGHALTLYLANPRPALLRGLPREIENHISHRGYGPDGDPETLRQRVLEVLAEAYVFTLVGRADELPAAVMSDLMFILTTVEGDKGIRFEFDEDTGRTLSRVEKDRLVFPDDPELGGLLAQRPAAGIELEARELDQPSAAVTSEDELARRRTRRKAA